MSFINNKKDNIISLKITEVGRRKIANGTLNYSKWAIGDSEINYERELYENENETNTPPKILLPADVQPNLKYLISTDPSFDNVKSDILTGDIDLMKITTNAITPERGLTTTEKNGNSSFIPENIKMISTIKTSNISGKNIILDNVNGLSIGDLIFIEILYSAPTNPITDNSINYRHYSTFKILNVNTNSKTITLNRTPKKYSNVTTLNSIIYDGKEVGLVEKWNTDDNIVWNDTTLNYDLNQNTISNTKPWSYNIVTLEQLAGYLDHKSTIGYKYTGLVENYLNYNDDLNILSDEIKETGCSEKLINGVVDNFKKIVGVIHFENGHHTNMYGDSFYIVDEKKLTLNLPSVMHYSTKENIIGLTLVSNNVEKKLLGTEITYHDLVISGSDIVVGKVFPHFKIIIIEDEEINTAMSIGSGRNYTLPPLSGKLITDSSGILPSGKQIYVTYTFRDKIINDVIHCNKYLVITNTTTTPKNVELKFENIKDFVHMINPNVNDETGYTSDNFEIIYQITDIDERPLPGNWMSVNFTNGLLFRSGVLGRDVLNPIALTTKSFIIKNGLTLKNYSSIEEGVDSTKQGIIGDETVLIGSLTTNISSIIYKSLIQIRINSNLFKYTTNPTKVQPNQQPIVSEIGIYDSQDDLVMIAKLSNPIQLSTRSSILLELSMDF